MIEDSEVLAGLAFLSRYARPELRAALDFALAAVAEVRAKDKLTALRSRPVDDLELSVRALNALAHMGFKKIGDVEKFFGESSDEYVRRNWPKILGQKTIKEIRSLLRELGLERRHATS